ncbi:hypothetical protein F5Y18DRAFT_404797 [Xylariaceae sp. FL1019]|nr:hypothetical protein F5Y18DRAFT_404797 [Xylariaceae sp. FL1019]
MDVSHHIIYTQCWVVLGLYIAANLFMLFRRSCIGSAATFLLSCILWISITIFNLWCFLPAFINHVSRIELASGDYTNIIHSLIVSDAVQDVLLMITGWFGSCLSISNAASILESDGCEANGPHQHDRISGACIKMIYRLHDYVVGPDPTGPINLPKYETKINSGRRQSVVFAIPRGFHAYASQPMSLSTPAVEYPAEKRTPKVQIAYLHA